MLTQAILGGEREEEEKRNDDLNFPLFFIFPVLLGVSNKKSTNGNILQTPTLLGSQQ